MWLNKDRQNVKLQAKLCLDVHGGRNVHNRFTIWYKCHNGANQAWYVDQTGFRYPKQVYKDGVQFQIKSKMSTFRAAYWAEQIGGNQFRLRIRNNKHKDNRQWWIFDMRTRTIRASARRSYAISNQDG